MRIIRKSEVTFADDRVEKQFESLGDDDEIKNHIKRAIRDIQANAFCGIQLPKKLIPGEYIQKYKVGNLWKYDLPSGWRLIYSITTPTKIEILAVILEWFDHKGYERRFGY
jgi:Txe/YoeB family toxin of Txe-Axe toxin-antitoxin module